MHSQLPRPLRLQHIFGFRRNAQAATLKRLLEAHILDFRPLVALESGYLQMSAALLTKFDISPETYRQRFRATGVPAGETPTETYHRLRGLYRRWIRPDILSKDAIGELIVLEQLLCVLPPDVRMWVKEHNLEDGLTAAKLALQYQNAHRGFTRFPSSSQRPAPPPGPPSAPPPRPTQDLQTGAADADGRHDTGNIHHRRDHKRALSPSLCG
uniref:SCAN box domain-containing protein n=1 Tax=Knipowitschia caucasica TaxID=637954 RepID=A0AAV2M935_KNICA